MTKKKIYKQWTVKSFDLEKFDDEINSNLEIGWEIVEGSYLISEEDGEKMISQVLVWKDDDIENLTIKFDLHEERDEDWYEIGSENWIMDVERILIDPNDKDLTTTISWRKNRFGEKYSKIEKTRIIYRGDKSSGPLLINRLDKITNKYGEISELIEYDKNGIRNGRYIYHGIEGSFKDGKPYGSWSVKMSPWGILYGEYLDVRNERIREEKHYIFFENDFYQKLYEELNKNTKKEERIFQGESGTGQTYEWKMEVFQTVNKSFLIFESDSDKYIPIGFFSGSIQLRTQKWSDNPRMNLGIQIINGKLIDTLYGSGNLKEKKESKIEKFHEPEDEFSPDHVVSREITFCKKNNSDYQKYIVKESNPKTKSLLKKLIYFPKTFGHGTERYLDSSERICIEQYYTGEKDNDPKGIWKRYFPDGQLNLVVEFLSYSEDETLKSKIPNRGRLFKKRLKYFDSNGVLRYESSSIIVVHTDNSYIGHPPQQNVIEVLDRQSYGNDSEYYDILFGLDIKLENLKNCRDFFNDIYVDNQFNYSIESSFRGSSMSPRDIYHQEFLMDKYYKWDKNGNMIQLKEDEFEKDDDEPYEDWGEW